MSTDAPSKLNELFCVVFERSSIGTVLLCDERGIPRGFETMEAAHEAAMQTFLGKRLGYKVYNMAVRGAN